MLITQQMFLLRNFREMEMMVDGPMVDGVVVEPESSKVAAAVVEDIMVVVAAVSLATPDLVDRDWETGTSAGLSAS